MNKIEIVTHTLKANKLLPYVPAWEHISNCLNGIGQHYPDLDFNEYIVNNINQVIDSQGELGEQTFIMLMLNAKCFVHNFVCRETGKVWEPTEEYFADFQKSCEGLIATKMVNPKERHKQVYQWIIQLCDWDSASLSSESKSKSNLH